MSIVEKVINRESGRNRPPRNTDALASNVSRQGAVPEERHPADTISLTNLKDRGLISILEDEEISRAFRFVKRAVLGKIFEPARKGQEPGKVVMITSAMPDAGKSFLAFNLAVSIAQEQLINVVLIDADTVRRKLSTTLGLRDSEGLLEILAARQIKAGPIPTDLPSLSFLPAGQVHSNATELLASAYLSEVLGKFIDTDTVVVIDTTPLLVSSEAHALAARADHNIVVVEAGVSSVDEIESSLQILQGSGSSIGFVMNKLMSASNNGPPDYYYEVY